MHEKRLFFQQKLLEKAVFNFKLTGLAGRFRQMENALSLWPRQKSASIFLSPNKFDSYKLLFEASLVTAHIKACDMMPFCLKPEISVSPF